jgi:putative endonuclease
VTKKANKLKGDVGEGVAAAYLEQHEFEIICRNYRKKWGEIDIVASRGEEIHFIEVKATVVKTLKDVGRYRKNGYLPEERVNNHKMQQLRRIIETFLMEFSKWHHATIVVDIAAVYLGQAEQKGRVFLIENVMLE